MLKIGILGLGNQGLSFLKAFKDLTAAELTAVCDIDKAKLEIAKKESSWLNPDLSATADIDSFLSSGIDIVALCLPAFENKSAIEKIIKKDLSIICSLPLSNSAKDADLIAQMVKQSKVKFMPLQILEFFSSYNEFRNVIKRGKIGEVGFMRASIGGGYPASFNGWLDHDELGGGVILNLGLHAIYFLISIFGKVKRVYCRRRRIIGGGNKKDYALILMRFNDDSIVHLELSWAYPDGTPYISKLDAFGTNGQLSYDDTSKQPITLFGNKPENKSYNLYNENNPLAGNPYRLVIESFVGDIELNSHVNFKIEDSMYALRVAICCLESASKNQVV